MLRGTASYELDMRVSGVHVHRASRRGPALFVRRRASHIYCGRAFPFPETRQVAASRPTPVCLAAAIWAEEAASLIERLWSVQSRQGGATPGTRHRSETPSPFHNHHAKYRSGATNPQDNQIRHTSDRDHRADDDNGLSGFHYTCALPFPLTRLLSSSTRPTSFL